MSMTDSISFKISDAMARLNLVDPCLVSALTINIVTQFENPEEICDKFVKNINSNVDCILKLKEFGSSRINNGDLQPIGSNICGVLNGIQTLLSYKSAKTVKKQRLSYTTLFKDDNPYFRVICKQDAQITTLPFYSSHTRYNNFIYDLYLATTFKKAFAIVESCADIESIVYYSNCEALSKFPCKATALSNTFSFLYCNYQTKRLAVVLDEKFDTREFFAFFVAATLLHLDEPYKLKPNLSTLLEKSGLKNFAKEPIDTVLKCPQDFNLAKKDALGGLFSTNRLITIESTSLLDVLGPNAETMLSL